MYINTKKAPKNPTRLEARAMERMKIEIKAVSEFLGQTVSELEVYPAGDSVTGRYYVDGSRVWLPKVREGDDMRLMMTICFSVIN